MRTLIAIPCMDMVHTIFMKSLLALTKVGEVQFGMSCSSLIYDARNTLAKQAVSENFDRVLWFDSDMDFAPDTMIQLSKDLDEGRDFVSGLYFKRKAPIEPIIYEKVGYYSDKNKDEITPVAVSKHDYPEDSIFEVEGAGFGCVMMNTSLIKRVADEFGLPFSPMMGFGEDLSFCGRATQLGVKLYCDSRVKCGHVGLGTITEDTYKQVRRR